MYTCCDRNVTCISSSFAKLVSNTCNFKYLFLHLMIAVCKRFLPNIIDVHNILYMIMKHSHIVKQIQNKMF